MMISLTLSAPSDPPQNVIGVPTSSRSISLSWQPPSIPNGVIRQYRVSFTEQDSSQSWQLTTTSLGRQITGLHPYYTYSVRVAAVTIAEGPNSSVIQIQTYQDGNYIIHCKLAFMHCILPSLIAQCPVVPPAALFQEMSPVHLSN